MRSAIHQTETRGPKLWFAWRPVRAGLTRESFGWHGDRRWQWVWWEYVHWDVASAGGGESWNTYWLPEDPPDTGPFPYYGS